MTFELSQEQLIMQDGIAKYLHARYPFARRQMTVKGKEAFDGEMWQETAELGWQGMLFPASVGGYGGSPLDVVVLFEVLGRYLVVEPYMETALLFGGALQNNTGALVASILEGVIAGRVQGALAAALSWRPARLPKTKLVTKQNSYLLSGSKSVVYNAPNADWLIVSATMASKLAMVLVSPADRGVDIRAYSTVDGRSAADVHFDNVELPGERVLALGRDAETQLSAVLQMARLAACAENVGAATALLDKCCNYSKARRQFGQAIARFQSLQHMMADMFVESELMRSLCYSTAHHLDDRSSGSEMMTYAAKAKADSAGRFIAHHAIQLHGAIATTDEFSIGHYLKRIVVLENLFGGRADQIRGYELLSNSADRFQ